MTPRHVVLFISLISVTRSRWNRYFYALWRWEINCTMRFFLLYSKWWRFRSSVRSKEIWSIYFFDEEYIYIFVGFRYLVDDEDFRIVYKGRGKKGGKRFLASYCGGSDLEGSFHLSIKRRFSQAIGKVRDVLFSKPGEWSRFNSGGWREDDAVRSAIGSTLPTVISFS